MTAPFSPMTREDVAQVLGIEVRCLANWIADGQVIAPKMIGSRVFWHPEVFYTWLDGQLRNGKDAAEARSAAPAKASLIPAKRSTRGSPSGTAEIQLFRDREAAKLRDMGNGASTSDATVLAA